MSKCNDQKLGTLLHAYELKALPDQERENFELHLMQCDHCLRELREFENYAGVIQRSSVARTVVDQQVNQRPETLWRRLWPVGPLFLKPAVLYGLLALLLVPAYFGITSQFSGPSDIRPVQSLVLSPIRSAESPSISSSGGPEGVAYVLFPDAVSGKNYQLRITDETGRIIATRADVRFDANGGATLLVPLSTMHSGIYRLAIIDPAISGDIGSRVYQFRVVD